MAGFINSRLFVRAVQVAKPAFVLLDYSTAFGRLWLTEKEDPGTIAEKVDLSGLASKALVILAVYQNKELCPNFEQMLEVFAAKELPVLVFNNGKLPAECRRRVSALTSLYHERKSGSGRDFASYQTGVQVIDHLIAAYRVDPERIIFANDSVFIEPQRYSAFIDRVLADPSDWIGVTETTEYHYHVSSWFFAVSRSMWDSAAFRSFWAAYLPLHCRRHAIVKGEIALSTTLTSAGQSPHVHYSSAHFINIVKSLPTEELSSLVELVAWHFFERTLAQSTQADTTQIYRARLGGEFLRSQENTNQTAYWQLIALVASDFPFIKKDIRYRGVFSLTQLRLAVLLLRKDNPTLSRLLDRVIATRDPSTLSPYQAARYLLGLD